MSLVGSLEDLGLGDILQIVSLARKSGRLILRTDGEAGRIVVCEGMVRGAAIKGGVEDLRGLLVGGGQVSGDHFERAREHSRERGLPLEEGIVAVAGLARERLDALRREQVERAVMRMFSWRTGEFSFEVRDEPDPEDLELLLPGGINTQYLAMEATRLRDEGSLLGEPSASDGLDDEAPLFSGEDLDLDPLDDTGSLPSAVDAIALASARAADPPDDDPDEATQSGIDPVVAAPHAKQPGTGARGAAIPVQAVGSSAPLEVSVDVAPARPPPLVAIDCNLTSLEWLKLSAGDVLPRVHIFQRDEFGMDRVRRYLARGVVPLVVLSPELLAADTGSSSLVERLRSLSPEMRILAMLVDGGPPAPAGFDGGLVRPAALGPDPEQWGPHEPLAAALRDALLAAAREGPSRPRTTPPQAGAALQNLRLVSDRLRDPERRDDVLSLVLDFACRDLSRVAIFMLRDDAIVGMAQRNMHRADGPDDAALREIEIPRDELPTLFARALEGRRGVRGGMREPDAAGLATRLGGGAPQEAYVAPIESGGCVAALLYADNLPVDEAIPDTTALEIVLHEAGLALDRALLERALEDARAR